LVTVPFWRVSGEMKIERDQSNERRRKMKMYAFFIFIRDFFK
jgi:hypothetical protein